MSVEPIRVSEMREGDPYVRINFDVTNWGCPEETGPHPLMPVQVEEALERLLIVRRLVSVEGVCI